MVKVDWKPYMIDPGTAKEGEQMEAYCRRRWGSSGWTQGLKREGRKDGAQFGNWQWWPHTLKGHQWVHYGTTHDDNFDTNKANEILFRSMYEEGSNLSLTDNLVALASREYPHWNQDDLRHYLEQGAGARDVQQEISQGSRQYGISGVPYFIVSNEEDTPCAFSGAQSSSAFLNVFEELIE